MSISASRRIVDRLYQQHVAERDLTLLTLVLKHSVTQNDLDEALQACDIEVMGAHKSLMFSYLMRNQPELEFPSYTAPRLKGLVNFYRFANLRLLSHFSRISKTLEAADIPVLLFKGGAMKALRPDLSRPMGDVDILVPQERFAEAVTICEGLGYHNALTGNPIAVDLHTAKNESAVDVHKAFLTTGKDADIFHKELFRRARATEAFGVRFFLPTHEDLFFMVLANLTKNLREKSSTHGLFYSFFDIKFLLSDKPEFDWGIVRENIRNTDAELPTRFAAEFMNALVPGIVPDMDTNLPLSSAMDAYCNQIIFDEDFFHRKQTRCQAIRVVDLKNYPMLYGKMIFKFLLLKKLRNHPAFVRWYLKKHENNYEN